MSETKTKWHKYLDDKPPISEETFTPYLVTIIFRGKKLVDTGLWVNEGYWSEYSEGTVLAWAEMPEPFEDGENGQNERID